MAHTICFIRSIVRNVSVRYGFIACKCVPMCDLVLWVSCERVVLEVCLKVGHKCFVLVSHVWHSFTYVFGRSSDTHVLQRQAGCLFGDHGGVLCD